MIDILEQKEILKSVFKEVVLEVIHEQKISFYDSIFPNATQNEVVEIEQTYGSPMNYKSEEFIDMTDWVNSAI